MPLPPNENSNLRIIENQLVAGIHTKQKSADYSAVLKEMLRANVEATRGIMTVAHDHPP
jgi:hypothetical protein